MVVLAIPINKPFEVVGDKVELFDKKVKESKGKQILLDRLKKHSKDDIGWKWKIIFFKKATVMFSQ